MSNTSFESISYESVSSVQLDFGTRSNSSVSSATSPTNLLSAQLDQAADNMKRYWFWHHLKQSPHFIHVSPSDYLLQKVHSICRRILSLPLGPGHRIALLIREFVRHSLPLTRLYSSCQPYLSAYGLSEYFPLSSYHQARMHIIPLYRGTLSKIREHINGRKLFLSFSRCRFKVEDENNGTLQPEKYAQYLFVIVGTINESGDDTQSRPFVVKVQNLDFARADVLQSALFDSLKLLWTGQDYLAQARHHLTHLIMENDNDYEQMNKIVHQYEPLSHLSIAYYVPKFLHQLELNLRRRYSLVTTVIDIVRRYWLESAEFQREFKYIAQREMIWSHSEPPASFYDSATFYSDNYRQIQTAVLCSYLDASESFVHTAFQSPSFRTQVNSFARDATLCNAISRSSNIDPYLLSCTIGTLFTEIVRVYEQSENSTPEEISSQLNDAVSRHLDRPRGERRLLLSGYLQVVCQIIERQLQVSGLGELIHSDAIKCHLVNSVADPSFVLHKPNKAPAWNAPVWICQLERCFPRFYRMFRLWRAPLPWTYLPECAVVYCYSETMNPQQG